MSVDIPEDEQTGLSTSIEWEGDFAEVILVDEDEEQELTSAAAITRLRRFLAGPDSAARSTEPAHALWNRLAWTLTYFAYGCRCYRRRIGKPAPDYLAIACAPATFDSIVTAALYVPIACQPRSRSLARAVLKTLYLARALGLPLENLKEFQKGRALTKGQQAHQTSAIIDSIAADLGRLSQAALAEMGGHLLARIHLLRAAINVSRERASCVDLGTFPGPWATSVCPLEFYSDIGLQLGMARAQDAPEDEQMARDRGALLNSPYYQPNRPGFREQKDSIFYSSPQIEPNIRALLKHSSFAVLFLLALKSAVYHTIRACCKGSVERIRLKMRQQGGDVVCEILNPAVPGDDSRESKDAIQLSALAGRLSGIGKPPCDYKVEGPSWDSDRQQWQTTITASSKNQS